MFVLKLSGIQIDMFEFSILERSLISLMRHKQVKSLDFHIIFSDTILNKYKGV